MAQTVLVFVEQRGGELKKTSLEAIEAAKRLADGGTVAAVIAGKGIGGLASGLGAYGVAQVYAADGDALDLYNTEAYAAAVSAAVEKASPALLVFSGTAMGKDLAPRLAARLGWTYLPDLTALALEGDRVVATRPQFAGKAIWKLAAPARELVLAVRPNAVAAAAAGDGSAAVEALEAAGSFRGKTLKLSAKEAEVPDVAEAEKIVAVGRGLKGPENLPLAFDLAKALGAGVGASRAIVDAGWIDHDHQVGQTGKTVSPSLYIAAGVSGAIQHLAGMRTSKCIVAINKDAEAPIFQVADYGIVGDALEILPRLTEAVKQARGS